jgi:8-oxo-dGTP pyrophosphatase MutT (NUDIX family)
VGRTYQLQGLLKAYSPGRGEKRAYADMVVLAEGGDDVFSRHTFSPGHFTASGFVVSSAHELLLVFHERLGKWLQPGGHIEPDDPGFLVAAAREVIEETGLDTLVTITEGLFDIDVHLIPAAGIEPPHTHHDLSFLFEAEGDPIPGAGVRDAAWIPMVDVADYTDDRSVLRAVTKLL